MVIIVLSERNKCFLMGHESVNFYSKGRISCSKYKQHLFYNYIQDEIINKQSLLLNLNNICNIRSSYYINK